MGVGLGDCWLLPSEPFPFKGKHLRGFEENHPDKRFKLVDGEAFSWYGSRMLHVTEHLREVVSGWRDEKRPEWVCDSLSGSERKT